MPTYEFRCRQCGDTFTVNRSMEESSRPSSCPAGHSDTVRLLTIGAAAGRTAEPASGGGCCGGGCGCG